MVDLTPSSRAGSEVTKTLTGFYQNNQAVIKPGLWRLDKRFSYRQTDTFIIDQAGLYIVLFANYSGRVVVEIRSPQVKVYIFGLYYGSKASRYQLETVQHHQVGKSQTDLFIKGVFDDDSRFDYKGLIKIEKQAQQTHAYQKNQNLILSASARVESDPFLEIAANDVFCTHGSTTGTLSETEIYYLLSRGISRPQAEKLLVDGFLNEVNEKIKVIIDRYN